jgi:hypothetical protein
MAAAARARDAALATAIFTAGDCAAQQLEHGVDADTPATYSGERTAGASLLGLIWGGMISPTVYRFNESLYPGKQPRSVAKKIVLSVGLLGCCGNWALIFFRRLLTPSIPPSSPTSSPVGAAEPTAGISERISATARSVNKDFLTVMSHDLKVWPLADLLVFTLIPIRLRVAFVSSVSVCWQSKLRPPLSHLRAAPTSSPRKGLLPAQPPTRSSRR